MTTWPDVEVLVRSWLASQITASVVTETDSTFATSAPSAAMGLPLVLVQALPAAGTDLYTGAGFAAVDVYSFAVAKSDARTLAQSAGDAMARIIGQHTPRGVVDDLMVDALPYSLNYSNPDVHRYAGTYRLSFRRQ